MKRTGYWRIVNLFKLFIVLSIPLWLVLSATRLLTTERFLKIEYSRSGFPADPFGLTQEERMAYAPYAIQYLVTDYDKSFLEDLEFPDGAVMFNSREIEHLVDVKQVIQVAFVAHVLLSFGMLVSIAVSIIDMTIRIYVLQAIRAGSFLTLALIMSLVGLALVSWNLFFEQFHRLFFADGTWQFQYSDTLIRLFPEQFWFDAALGIGILTIVGAVLLIVFSRIWQGK